jgi:hypothetical protein
VSKKRRDDEQNNLQRMIDLPRVKRRMISQLMNQRGLFFAHWPIVQVIGQLESVKMINWCMTDGGLDPGEWLGARFVPRIHQPFHFLLITLDPCDFLSNKYYLKNFAFMVLVYSFSSGALQFTGAHLTSRRKTTWCTSDQFKDHS